MNGRVGYFQVEVTATNHHRLRINESSRSRTMQYYFSDGDGPSALQSAGDKRGRHEAANKISGDQLNLIRSHIYSHHPAISH